MVHWMWLKVHPCPLFNTVLKNVPFIHLLLIKKIQISKEKNEFYIPQNANHYATVRNDNYLLRSA